MKTTYAEWKAYLDAWPEGQWFDDSDETIDGIPADEFEGEPQPTATVEFTAGVVFADDKNHEGQSLVRHFRKWQKAQAVELVLCEVPKDRIPDFRAALAQFGAKARN